MLLDDLSGKVEAADDDTSLIGFSPRVPLEDTSEDVSADRAEDTSEEVSGGDPESVDIV